MKKSIVLGVLASFFFSFTFLLNRQMHVTGGSWQWSASLRYFFMFPILWFLLSMKKQTNAVMVEIRNNPAKWFLYSTIGFGIFYAPLCYASIFSPSWLIAGTWQITIVAGALMTPLFQTNANQSHKIPMKVLLFSTIILSGILCIQLEEGSRISLSHFISGSVPILIAAFAYPYGNRKMIALCEGRINTLQRIYGMTLCSLPFFLIIAVFGILQSGLPSYSQITQSALVAIFSGVIATLLFFKATDLISYSNTKLAIVEATQSGEVLFTVLGGIFVFHDSIPGSIGMIGIILIIIGMILNCYFEK